MSVPSEAHLFLSSQARGDTYCVSGTLQGTRDKKGNKNFPSGLVAKNLPMQGTWVRDATCCSETKPMHHNY